MPRGREQNRDRDEFYLRIGGDIRSIRERIGMTIDELSRKTLHTTEYLEHLERGQISISMWSYYNIMDALEAYEDEQRVKNI